MELFKLSCKEVTELKDSTLDSLIAFNRELKVSFSSIKKQELEFKESMPEKLHIFSKSKYFYSQLISWVIDIKQIEFDPSGFDSKAEMHCRDSVR